MTFPSFHINQVHSQTTEGDMVNIKGKNGITTILDSKLLMRNDNS